MKLTDVANFDSGLSWWFCIQHTRTVIVRITTIACRPAKRSCQDYYGCCSSWWRIAWRQHYPLIWCGGSAGRRSAQVSHSNNTSRLGATRWSLRVSCDACTVSSLGISFPSPHLAAILGGLFIALPLGRLPLPAVIYWFIAWAIGGTACAFGP